MNRTKQLGLWGAMALGLAPAVGPGAWAGQFLAAGPVIPSGAGFDEAVAAGELQDARAGDVIIVSSPSQTAHQEGNTIEGDAPSGSVVIPEGAMNGLHGVGQIVANTAAHGVAQGSVTMILVLNPAPAEP